ncbi:splicing factor U2AF 35 kDa subunit-like [Gordionus sp. m RMFG-2023]|uniref:splicing factor U2AF 35 kDa subunit-like n=1 Tax=Gordionus sp. m RMFG-2023 TaxID=3053472 RepID=UPI0031FBAD13
MKGQVIENAPKFSDEEEQKHFDDVFEELYMELEDEYGQIDELNICQNLGRHLYGNVYVKFRKSESADKALMSINNRWFDQRPINAELSPVVDFRAACCPQYEEGNFSEKSKDIANHIMVNIVDSRLSMSYMSAALIMPQ